MSVAANEQRWTLPALCLSVGLAGLSVSVTAPILVDIATYFAITEALAGQLMTVASLAGMAGTLGLSPLLDRIGRREAIVITLCGIALACMISALAPSFAILMVVYGFVGLGGYTLLALVLATIGDLYDESRLGKAMGWAVAGNVGVGVVGLPIIAALSDRFGWPYAFLFYALLALSVAYLVYRSLPAGVKPLQVQNLSYLSCFGYVFRRRSVAFLLVTVAVIHAAIYGFGIFLGAAGIKQLGVSTTQIGPVFSLRYFGTALAGVLAGRYLRATDWRVTAGAAAASAVFSVIAYTFPTNLWFFAFIALLHGTTVGVMDVGLNSLVVSAESASRGAVTALRSVMDSLGGIVGPALGGAFIAASGYPAAGWLFAALALVAAITTFASAREQARQANTRNRVSA